jgi:hypothetical protein
MRSGTCGIPPSDVEHTRHLARITLQRQNGDQRDGFHTTRNYGGADRQFLADWLQWLGKVQRVDLYLLFSTQHQRLVGGFRYQTDCTIVVEIPARWSNPSSLA